MRSIIKVILYVLVPAVCNSLKSGVSVIVDFSSPYVTMTIRSLAEAMGITHVAGVDPSYYEMNTMQVSQSPHRCVNP